MAQSIEFHGAAQTVTGSRHLLELDGKLVLVDCGLFQGSRELRDRNWEPFPVDPSELDAVVITHAHTDHIGYLPRLVAQGYRGPIYATPATCSICRISLPDSARIQEEDARFANKKGYSRHHPAEPLYTERDAYAALKQFKPVHYWQFQDLPAKATFRFMPAGHILGSAIAEIYFANGERIIMSGDIGRYNAPIIVDPSPVDFGEYLVVESTYGDRLHSDENPQELLEEVLKDAYANGRCIVVPSFAIGRTQELLYHLSALQRAGRVPRVPIFVDSPMATTATALYDRNVEDHDKDMKLLRHEGEDPLEPDHMQFVRDSQQSKALNVRKGPMMVIAGGGMLTGGRIVHHLKHRLSDPSTLVLFTGYQAEGTRGRALLEGAETMRIHGEEIPVRAEIRKMSSLSAHADQSELLRWMGGIKTPPRQVFLVHGEPEVQETFKSVIERELGWPNVTIPAQGDRFEL